MSVYNNSVDDQVSNVSVNVNIGNISIGKSNGSYGYPLDKHTYVVRTPYEALGPYGFRLDGTGNFKANAYFTHAGMLADAMENYTTVVTRPDRDPTYAIPVSMKNKLNNVVTAYVSPADLRSATGTSVTSYGSLGRFLIACAGACIQRKPLISVSSVFPGYLTDELAINRAIAKSVLTTMATSAVMSQIKQALLGIDGAPYDALDTNGIGLYRPGSMDIPVEVRLSIDVQLSIPVYQVTKTLTLTGVSIVLLLNSLPAYRANQIAADDSGLHIASDYGTLLRMGESQNLKYNVPSVPLFGGSPLTIADILSLSRGNGNNYIGVIDCSGQAYSVQRGSPNTIVSLNVPTTSSLYGRYVVDAVSGANHILFLDSTGYLHGTGTNSTLLGTGITAGSTTSQTVAIVPNKRFLCIGAGGDLSIAADASGTLYIWGQDASSNVISTPQVLNSSFTPKIQSVETNGSMIACIDVSGILYTCTYPASSLPVQVISGSITPSTRFTTVACSSLGTNNNIVAIDTGGGLHVQGTLSASSITYAVPTKISPVGSLGICTPVRACISNYGIFVQDTMGRVHALYSTKGDGTVSVPSSVIFQVIYSPSTLRSIEGNNYVHGVPYRFPFPGVYNLGTSLHTGDQSGENTIRRSTVTPGQLFTTTASGNTLMAMTARGFLYQLASNSQYGSIVESWGAPKMIRSFHASYYRDVYCDYSIGLTMTISTQSGTQTVSPIGSTSIFPLETVVYNDKIVFIRMSDNTLNFIPLVNITSTSNSPSMAATGMVSSDSTLTAMTVYSHDVQVSFKALRLGYNCMYAISTDNELYMWADASLVNTGVFPRMPSTLGSTRRENFSSGTIVANNVIDVAGTLAATAIVTKDRRVYLWGCQENVSGTSGAFVSPVILNSGSLGLSAQDNLAVRIVATEDTFAVLDVKGRVHTWGGNKYGQLGSPAMAGTVVPFVINYVYSPLYGKTIIDIGSTRTLLLVLDDSYNLYAMGTRYTTGNPVLLLEPMSLGNLGMVSAKVAGALPTPTPIPRALWTNTPTPVPTNAPVISVNQWSLLDTTSNSSDGMSSYEFIACIWAGKLGRFVALTNNSYVATSNNGVIWKLRTLPAGNMTCMAWSQELSIFVIGNSINGNAYWSRDGVMWYMSSGSIPGVTCMTWSDTLGIFVALPGGTSGSTNAYWSANGMRWYTVPGAVPATDWGSVSWSPAFGLFVALPRPASYVYPLYSSNGTVWTVHTFAPMVSASWQSIAWSPELNIFAGVGSLPFNQVGAQPVIYSTTGIGWSYGTCSVTTTGFSSVTWSSEAGCFFAMASTLTSGQSFIIKSTNGKTWTTVTSINATSSMTRLNTISWSPALRRFVAMGSPGNLVISLISEDNPTLPSNVFATMDNDISERAMVFSYYNDVNNTTNLINSSLVAMGAKSIWTPDYDGQRYNGSNRSLVFSIKYTNTTGTSISASFVFAYLPFSYNMVVSSIVVNGARSFDPTETVIFPPGFNTAVVYVDAMYAAEIFPSIRFAFVSNGTPIAMSDDNTRTEVYLNQVMSTSLAANSITYDPLLSDMIAWHDGDSYINSTWYNRLDLIYGNNVPELTGTFTRSPYMVRARQGSSRIALVADTNASATFNAAGIFGSLTDYTVMMVARYTSTTARQRILGASGIPGASNLQYIAGFHNGRSGVAYHGDSGTNGSGWIANNSTTGGTDLHGNDFCLIVDTPSRFRSNMVDRTTKNSSYVPASMQWRLNNMPNNENSNFAIAAIMFFKRTLQLPEIQIMENLLYKMYMDVSPLIDLDARAIQQLPDTEITTWLNNSPRKTIIAASGLSNVTGAPKPTLRHSVQAATSDTTFSRYVEFNRSWQQYFQLPSITLEAFKGLTIFLVVGFSSATTSQGERVFDFGNGAFLDNIFFRRSNVINSASRLAFTKLNGTSGNQVFLDNAIPDTNMHLYTLVLQGTTDVNNNVCIFRDAEKVPLYNTSMISFGQTRTQAVTLLINYIGRSIATTDAYFHGRIGLLRIYDQVLPDDIINEYRWDLVSQIPGNSLTTSQLLSTSQASIPAMPMVPPLTINTLVQKKKMIKTSIANRFGYHTLAVDGTGDVYAWGLNDSGQVGNNSSANIVLVPTLISGGSLSGKLVAQVAASRSTSLALDTNGIIHAWGSNANGQYGNGTVTSSLVPIQLTPAGSLATASVVYITMGAGSSYALDSVGRVHSWGSNSYGQLGNGNTAASSYPVLVPLPLGIPAVTIRAGERHAVAADASGLIYAWGDNSLGQCCGPEGIILYSSPVLVSMTGAVSVNSRADLDKIIFDTRTRIRQQIMSAVLNSNAPAISLSGLRLARVETGSFHTIIVYYMSTYNLVYGFGYNEYGQVCADATARQLTIRTPSLCFFFPNELDLVQSNEPLGLSVGSYHNVIYTMADSTLNPNNTSTYTKVRVFWGRSDGYSSTNSNAIVNTQTACMYTFSINPVYRVGSSFFYPGSISSDLPPSVTEVFAGTDSTLMMTHNGSVYAWGPGTLGSVGYLLQPHWSYAATPIRFSTVSMCQTVPRIYKIDVTTARAINTVSFMYGSIVVPLEISLVQSSQLMQIKMPANDADNTLVLLDSSIAFSDLGLTQSGLGTFYVGMYPGCIQVYSSSTVVKGTIMPASTQDPGSQLYYWNPLGIKSSSNTIIRSKAYNYLQAGFVDTSGTMTASLVSTCTAPVAPSLGTSLAYSVPDSLALAESSNGSISLRFFLSSTGKVFGYGINSSYVLSLLQSSSANVPNPLGISTRGSLQSATIRRIAVGLGHVIALDSQGRVHGWGNNANSQVTDNRIPGSNTYVGTPVMISTTGSLLSSTAGVVQVAAGDNSSYALDANGRLHVWGSNANNSLGLSTYTQVNSPFLNSTGSLANATLSQIDGKGTFLIALDSLAKVHTFGTLGTLVQALPALLTSGSCTNGTIAGVTISRVVAGVDNAAIITSTGAVYGFGANTKSRLLGNGDTTATVVAMLLPRQGSLTGKIVSQVALGANSTMVIDSTGRAHAWGDYINGVTSLFPVDISDLGQFAGKTFARAFIPGKTHVLVDTTGVSYSWISFPENTNGLLVYPPIALTSNDTIVENQVYGNGLYKVRASGQVNGAFPPFAAFNKSPGNASTGAWLAGNYNYGNSYTGSASTNVNGVSYAGEWLEIMMPQQVAIWRIVIYPPTDMFVTRNPKNFIVAGSNDGVTFTRLLTVSGYSSWAYNVGSTFNLENNTTPYYYYRICVGLPGTNALYATIGEMYLYSGTVPHVIGAFSDG